MTDKPTPKSEALRALEHAIKRLGAPETLDVLDRRVLLETLDYAQGQIEAIQELKRPRKKGGLPAAP